MQGQTTKVKVGLLSVCSLGSLNSFIHGHPKNRFLATFNKKVCRFCLPSALTRSVFYTLVLPSRGFELMLCRVRWTQRNLFARFGTNETLVKQTEATRQRLTFRRRRSLQPGVARLARCGSARFWRATAMGTTAMVRLGQTASHNKFISWDGLAILQNRSLIGRDLDFTWHALGCPQSRISKLSAASCIGLACLQDG